VALEKSIMAKRNPYPGVKKSGTINSLSRTHSKAERRISHKAVRRAGQREIADQAPEYTGRVRIAFRVGDQVIAPKDCGYATAVPHMALRVPAGTKGKVLKVLRSGHVWVKFPDSIKGENGKTVGLFKDEIVRVPCSEKDLKKVYEKHRRPAPVILRFTRGRYRYEIWRITGAGEDDQVRVDEVDTFSTKSAAEAMALKLSNETGWEHIAAEYDASETPLPGSFLGDYPFGTELSVKVTGTDFNWEDDQNEWFKRNTGKWILGTVVKEDGSAYFRPYPMFMGKVKKLVLHDDEIEIDRKPQRTYAARGY
jgi:hypothetical protein